MKGTRKPGTELVVISKVGPDDITWEIDVEPAKVLDRDALLNEVDDTLRFAGAAAGRYSVSADHGHIGDVWWDGVDTDWTTGEGTAR